MDLQIKSILFVADFATDTGFVLDHALGLARKYQAKIHIIYCFDIMKISTQSTAELYSSQAELEDSIEKSLVEEESHIRGKLQGICHQRLVELNAEETLIAGIDIERKPATEAILDAATVYRADIILMGAQRQAGPSNGRLIATATKVLKDATVPVLVVKGAAGAVKRS